MYTKGTDEKDVIDNVNLTYNPATGANYPFSDVARRAFPAWGVVSMMTHNGRSEYHALQTAFRSGSATTGRGRSPIRWPASRAPIRGR